MVQFNLEKALAGEPVKLRNGNKGYITADYINFFPYNVFRYQGVFLIGKSETQFQRNSWNEDGASYCKYDDYPYLKNPFDIIGMWEENAEACLQAMREARR